ncbi:MAG TPA: DNA repair exonuclease [Desulfobacteraceae bacterium]|nr:DNA repair exonuclease [Desulfobacteraceae bacterium]
MRFIHTADIHLDSPLKGLEVHEDAPVEEIRIATRRAFDRLIELAVEEEVDFVLIAGDLYDGDWKDYNTGHFFVDRLGRLAKAGIRVFLVTGNHDAASQITRTMPLPGNTTLFPSARPQSVQLDDLGVFIHGQSYPSRAVTENLAARYPQREAGYFNIGLLHTSLTGREGHENYAPCSTDELLSKGYDYWALGHVHRREVVAEDPWIVFPGNIQGRHIRETGAKGATLVVVEDGRIVDVAQRELDVLRWSLCNIDLSGCATRDVVHEQVRHAMENAQQLAGGKALALRLLLEGRCPMHAELHARSDRWTEEFRAIAISMGDIWLEKVQFRTRRMADLDDILDGNSPLAGLLRSIECLEFGDAPLTTLVPDLADLKRKMPPELLDDDSLLENPSAALTELREEVRELLIARMLHQGGEA